MRAAELQRHVQAGRIEHVGGELELSDVANLPNAVTLSGYALGLWWIRGGPPWAALASVVADELDGRLARKTGAVTAVGGELDFGVDLVLGALSLVKLGAPLIAVPVSTLIQIVLREEGFRPPIGSMRAVLMLYGVLQEARGRRLRAL